MIKLTPKAYGCDEERCVHFRSSKKTLLMVHHRYTLPIGAVDTHRPKPGSVISEAGLANTTKREYFGDASTA